MRLLNTETFTLREFNGEKVEPYAILSHTWGEEHDEVGFNEIGTPDAVDKIGYQKIRFLCEEAKKRNIEWAWCDTCCINKDSSSELSESINSMFKWYQNAEVCFAYLSDVYLENKNDSSIDGPNVNDVPFKKSRWFKRGWTLQELLAPQKIEFYSRNWQLLGDRKSLVTQIQHTTEISLGALMWPWTIPGYSVAIRFSWAAHRKTTRPEDMAYCLLGIMGVHIPLLYGEGTNAFRRLQEEIIKSSDDESLFAHNGESILAQSPEEFGTYDFWGLPKTVPTPYALTNIGLHISIRLLDPMKAQEIDWLPKTTLWWGILNCHQKNEFQYLIAIPLRPTAAESVFVRAAGRPKKFPEKIAANISNQSIYIRLSEPKPLFIDCLLENHCVDYKFEVTDGKNYTRNRKTGQVQIYCNPQNPSNAWFEYRFYQTRRSWNDFWLLICFDTEKDEAGLIAASSWIQEQDSKRTRTELNDFEKSRKQSSLYVFLERPTEGGGGVEPVHIVATMKRDTRLERSVWILQVQERDVEDGSMSLD